MSVDIVEIKLEEGKLENGLFVKQSFLGCREGGLHSGALPTPPPARGPRLLCLRRDSYVTRSELVKQLLV